ncbi:helix-turn-helix domain-containing protein [Cytobacillus pseudoceanisediminis]|uniref:Transcriptional regulator n=2 Tax=Cytobacillus TaxID=2675230 RepID=A0ABX3CTD4_9BACI|nr:MULTISPECIES: helix-turn-helix domain-containing protein [Cytobacillus]MBU8731310.1 helix-turn-helix domain-containing protein [Cytobacillus oceanisediminis]MCM3242229.1 helix-turn-helix domain-containing protein [Cytobacillus oceanisediminis]MDK7664351.1 helix-turn-helix domain-containing protein [Cytobacillus oceanisediminis]OHX48737.1 transcriptional regulator [Cytobacillus oceanisediminis]QOK25061.1 helix-turn-helix domain-containing protein [Cytobacillus oceanisediminis]
MEQTLKITNVLSDPTRYYIYQYITKRHKDVTVQEIADNFSIHPNVARLHLSKLEDVNMLVSETKKTGKGGRPSRLYRLSDDVIQLHFPYRDYQLLAKITLETMLELGEEGRKALYSTGKKFGRELIQQELKRFAGTEKLTFDQKLNILKHAADMSGFHPEFDVNAEKTIVYFQIYNCPFKEVAARHREPVCNMHNEYLKGMFESLFHSTQLVEKQNMLTGCDACSYQAFVGN